MAFFTRFRILLICFCCLPFMTLGQVNNAQYFNPDLSTSGARHQPSLAGEGIDRFEISFLNTHAWVGNNNLSYGQIRDVLDADELTQDLVDETLNELERYNNHLSAGLEFTPFSLAVNIGSGEHPFTLTAGADVRVLTNFQYSKVLLDVIWNGNKQYRGEEVNLGPFKWNLLPVQEYYIGGSKAFDAGSGITLKPGVRLRLIQSMGSIYTERGDFMMYTQEDARRIRFDADYKVNTALQDRDDIGNIDFMKSIGSGFGMDLGLTTRISEKLSATLSVADIGSVNFNENTKTFSKNETYDFEGVNFRLNDPEEEDFTINMDSAEAFLEPNKSEEAYSMPLGTRFIFQGNYQFGEFTRNDGEGFKHQVYFLYVQGFNNHLKASSKPYFSGGYTCDLAKFINVGGSLSMGGYNPFTIGPHVSFKFGPYKLGLASNNMLPLLIPEAGTGFDASLNMALSF